MATRQQRLSEFRQDTARIDPAELLCEDHCGTFALPFPCRWSDGAWINQKTGATIEAAVIGWRAWDPR